MPLVPLAVTPSLFHLFTVQLTVTSSEAADGHQTHIIGWSPQGKLRNEKYKMSEQVSPRWEQSSKQDKSVYTHRCACVKNCALKI